jgi:hypothetical protein
MRKISMSLVVAIAIAILGASIVATTYPCFAETYEVEILSVDTGRHYYGAWWHMGEFAKTAYMQVKVTVRNNVGVSKDVRVTCSLMDELLQPVGFTQTTVTVPANTTQDVILNPVQVASYAFVGQAFAAICALTLQGAPYCPEYDAPFQIIANTSYDLTVQSYYPNGTVITGAIVWVDEVQYYTPLTVSLLQGIHIVKANNEYPYLGDRKFLYWEDYSTANPRSVTFHAAKLIKAYYNFYVEIVSAQVGRNYYGQWWAMTKFAKTAYLEAKVTLRNNALVAKDVKVTCTLMDELLTPVGYTEHTVTVPANSLMYVYLGPVQVASYAYSGQAEACICALQPGGAPYCGEYDVPFQILGNVNYDLTVRTYLTSGAELMTVNVWVDGTGYTSPVTVSVLQGTHVAKANYYFISGSYEYYFRYWEDNSTSYMRALDVLNAKTIRAYYDRYPYSPGGGGCPILFVYNGTEYVEDSLLNIHQPEGIDVTFTYTLVVKPQAVGSFYLLRLTEHPKTHSYIDQVKFYAVLENGRTIMLPLLSAVHSVHGNVMRQLLFSDDNRIDTEANESIYLAFAALRKVGVKAFVFVIEGHNPFYKT